MKKRNFLGILLIMLPGIVAASEGLLKIDILSYPNQLPAGLGGEVVDARGLWEGWAQVDMRVRVSYLGSEPLPIIPAHCVGYESGMFSVWAHVRHENGEEVRSCVCPSVADVVYTNVGSLKPGWSKEYTVPLCLPGEGVYSVEAVAGEEIDSFKVVSGEIVELWKGESTSQPVRIEVTAPTGIDKVAYDALGPNVVADSMRWGQLLQRFPTSTYAAYVIWERWAKGTAAGWKSDQGRDAFLSSLDNDPSFEYLTWKLPCNAGGDPNPMTITRFHMPEAARCRDAWLGKALVYHPDIWFADELRLKLALDAYLLNDKAACASKLEDLSAHAKPYVAKKARALLEAMQSKNMLPGGPKDLTATPAKTEPEGKTDQ